MNFHAIWGWNNAHILIFKGRPTLPPPRGVPPPINPVTWVSNGSGAMQIWYSREFSLCTPVTCTHHRSVVRRRRPVCPVPHCSRFHARIQNLTFQTLNTIANPSIRVQLGCKIQPSSHHESWPTTDLHFFQSTPVDNNTQLISCLHHMGLEGVLNWKKTPIFFVDAKKSQIAQGFQNCKF